MKRRVLIDTNLLMLLVVGYYDKDFVFEHKRTNKFTPDDFDVLEILIEGADIVLTPNVLTEASNLLWQCSEPHKSLIRSKLAQIAHICDEQFIASSDVISCPEFMGLGLTDAGILELKKVSGLILTQDLDLHLAALARGLETENFTHYRNLI
ncbi:PIN domain-containing protein [Pseudomonas sp.]|uniref:PIN domain-containing protein n=1 Tax=unclassified Pseudomonas TaxID=196821 RepID=UPI0019B0915D|nr:PIN domain-containing protein [Pseudomonas sp.]MBC6625722.1 hypothetical protein [Pseudomonas sp.]MBP6953978.1 hypothetical protein [Pseudomonas sp.]